MCLCSIDIWSREPLGSLGVARQVGRLELSDEGLHDVGIMVIMGWKGCKPIYCRA
jgi:hypothetical protein